MYPNPTSYKEATKHHHWCDAMSKEFEALKAQNTWIMVEPPPSQLVLEGRWLYKTKFNSNGSIARYKDYLIAQGNGQEFNIDYIDNCSHMEKNDYYSCNKS